MDVGSADFGVILRQRLEDNLALRFRDEAEDFSGHVQDSDFLGVAEVDGEWVIGVNQQAKDTFHQVVNVTEAAGLGAVSINGEGVIGEGLGDEVGQGTAVLGRMRGP